jgi:hypothetical protein
METKWKTPEAIATALGTELNSLGNATLSGLSGAIDNLTDLYRFVELQLDVTFGVAPSAGGYVHVLLFSSLDDTNYGTGHQDYTPAMLFAFPVRAVTTQQVIVSPPLIVPPLKFKLAAYNAAGQAFPASGSTIKYRRHNEQAV